MAEMQTTIFETDIVDFSNELRRTVTEGASGIFVYDRASTETRTITPTYGGGETLEILYATD